MKNDVDQIPRLGFRFGNHPRIIQSSALCYACQCPPLSPQVQRPEKSLDPHGYSFWPRLLDRCGICRYETSCLTCRPFSKPRDKGFCSALSRVVIVVCLPGKSTTVVCPAKTSSSRLAGQRAGDLNSPPYAIISYCFGQSPIGCVPLRYTCIGNKSSWPTATPPAPGVLSSRLLYISFIVQGSTPASPCTWPAVLWTPGTKLHAPSTVSNVMFGGSNLALRLCDDPPILQLPH
jgi:hypothetical protein